jgi:DNA-binding MarR family transcriptional regulator
LSTSRATVRDAAEDIDGLLISELNEVVHQRSRLGLLVVLREVREADFTYLKSRLKLTDGNLGQHIEILEHHGLVTVRKGYEGKRARTWVVITRTGERALAAEIKTLKTLFEM